MNYPQIWNVSSTVATYLPTYYSPVSVALDKCPECGYCSTCGRSDVSGERSVPGYRFEVCPNCSYCAHCSKPRLRQEDSALPGTGERDG